MAVVGGVVFGKDEAGVRVYPRWRTYDLAQGSPRRSRRTVKQAERRARPCTGRGDRLNDRTRVSLAQGFAEHFAEILDNSVWRILLEKRIPRAARNGNGALAIRHDR